jgi:adenosylcobinamide kinase/adenosylcobinamide-phosphate guanylyltransferase
LPVPDALPPARRDVRLTLVLGGARSGKSSYAEGLLAVAPPPWIYVATAEPLDVEMTARIAEHRRRRDHRWQTIEAPHDLAGALSTLPADASVLIDCLTLWLSNLLCAERDLAMEIGRLERALSQARGCIVAVSNEVGLGIVPDNALARRFRDVAGRLNQLLALRAQRVVLLVAGIPVEVKPRP